MLVYHLFSGYKSFTHFSKSFSTIHPAYTCPFSFFSCSANDVWIGDLCRGTVRGPSSPLCVCDWKLHVCTAFRFIRTLCQSCNRWTHNHPRVLPFTRIVLNCVCVCVCVRYLQWKIYLRVHTHLVSFTVSQMKCFYTHLHIRKEKH